MEFSIVIATKDRARYVDRALASLAAQRGMPSFEVIVVDNGSSDDTKAVVERRAAAAEIRYLAAPQPNRGAARNRGVAAAVGRYVLFCDDDVALPSGWLAAHAAAHAHGGARVVNGPILNVPSYDDRPTPRLPNYSRAFLCSCNASLPRSAFVSVGGFDERFDLYGWEDTELGLRLRAAGFGWKFAWDAYLWHVKPADENTLAVESRKAVEKARMAAKFLGKHPSWRARFATGAHPLNLLRARYVISERLLGLLAGVATDARAPAWANALARAQLLDALYARELLASMGRAGE